MGGREEICSRLPGGPHFLLSNASKWLPWHAELQWASLRQPSSVATAQTRGAPTATRRLHVYRQLACTYIVFIHGRKGVSVNSEIVFANITPRRPGFHLGFYNGFYKII